MKTAAYFLIHSHFFKLRLEEAAKWSVIFEKPRNSRRMEIGVFLFHSFHGSLKAARAIGAL